MVEPNWVVQGLFAGGLGGVALLVGQWVTRRNFRENLVKETRAEQNQYTIDSFESIQAEAGKLRIELRERISELEAEIHELRTEVENSRSERELLHQEYVRLHTAHERLLIEHTQLRMEHMNLQQQHDALKLTVVRKHQGEV